VTGFRIRFTANSPGESKPREFERFHLPVRRGVSFDRTGQLPHVNPNLYGPIFPATDARMFAFAAKPLPWTSPVKVVLRPGG
jgi:hypothetical protein